MQERPRPKDSLHRLKLLADGDISVSSSCGRSQRLAAKAWDAGRWSSLQPVQEWPRPKDSLLRLGMLADDEIFRSAVAVAGARDWQPSLGMLADGKACNLCKTGHGQKIPCSDLGCWQMVKFRSAAAMAEAGDWLPRLGMLADGKVSNEQQQESQPTAQR